MKVLVTGGAGFVGRHLVQILAQKQCWTLVVDPKISESFEASLPRLRQEGPFDSIVHLAANIENLAARQRAGVTAYQDLVLDYKFARWVEMNPPRYSLVWMTSCATDAPELDPYSHVKLSGERLALTLARHGMPVQILRPYSGYGEDQSLEYPFPAIFQRALQREDPLRVWGTGKQIRDFVHVEDLARAIWHAMQRGFPVGRPVPIGTGVGTDFITLASKIANSIQNYHPKIEADTSKPSSSLYRVADPGLASEYGWKAQITLEEGIQMAVDACIR